MDDDIHKILVVGYSVRYIACSGKRAGYEMHCIDHFNDLDLQNCGDVYPLGDIETEKDLKCFIDDHGIEFDAIILGSGFERFRLEGVVLNNASKVMENVTNKRWLARRLEELGVPHPQTYTTDYPQYPAIAKPIFGAGGVDISLVYSENDLPQDDSFLLQEYISGMPASVSVISTKDEAVAVAVNEQIVGMKDLGQTFPFGYCGSITPFQTDFALKMCKIAEDIVLDLELIGTNGVDFILTEDDIFVIEVNPRFQATLDTIELSTDINIFDAHLRAFNGDLIDKRDPYRFAAKSIVYTEEEFELRKDLRREGILDITPVGTVVPKGDPVATATGVGTDREEALSSMMENVFFIKGKIRKSSIENEDDGMSQ
ncbi:MAG: ATP-grasp domain-containing protein [Halobacteriota archaeon]|nr:ATP-grasp domain-containing protein [Halobacteriota archaeon]